VGKWGEQEGGHRADTEGGKRAGEIGAVITGLRIEKEKRGKT